MRLTSLAPATVALVAAVSAAAADKTYAVDSLDPNQPATNAERTWAPGEAVAVVFSPTAADGPVMLKKIVLHTVVGDGQPTPIPVVIDVWQDPADGTADVPADSAKHLVSALAATVRAGTATVTLDEPVRISTGFRVAVTLQSYSETAPTLSFAEDAAAIVEDRNFAFTPGQGWAKASSLGVTHNWVLRAVVDPFGPLTVTEISPNSCPKGASWVTLNGSGFDSTVKVAVDRIPVRNGDGSRTQITLLDACGLPQGTYDVLVTRESDGAQVELPQAFTIKPNLASCSLNAAAVWLPAFGFAARRRRKR